MQGDVGELVRLLRERFDADYYARANPDVAQASRDLLGHFILHGLIEGRAPNPAEASTSLRADFIKRLGRLPDRADLEHIYNAYLDERQPLRRFAGSLLNVARFRHGAGGAASGKTKGLSSSTHPAGQVESLASLIDLTAFNASNSAGVTFRTAQAAAEYMMEQGYRQLDPIQGHLRFDPRFYKSFYSEAAELRTTDAYLDWLRYGAHEGRVVSLEHLKRSLGIHSLISEEVFDAVAYCAVNPDLPADWSWERLAHHFLTNGLCERRFNFPISTELLRVLEDRLERLAHSDPANAVGSAEHLLSLGYRSSRLSLLVAGHYLDENRPLPVLLLMDQARPENNRQAMFRYYNISEALRRVGDNDRAAANLRLAVETESANLHLLDTYERLVRDTFSHEAQIARTSVQDGDFEAGRKRLSTAIDKAFCDILAYGSGNENAGKVQAIAPPRRRRLRIGLLSDLFLPQCKLYRVDQKVEQLECAGVESRVYDFRSQLSEALRDVANFDAWIIYRTPAFYDILKFVKLASTIGRPTIYEIDDLVFDPEHFPEPIESYGGNLSVEEYGGLILSAAYTRGVAHHCHYGIASTPALAAELGRHVRTGKCLVHRNALSSVHAKAIEARRTRPAAESGPVRIFYGSGTKAHKDFLEDVFFSALAEVMDDQPGVEFQGIGFLNSKALSNRFEGRLRMSEPIWDVAQYWRLLGNCDINVAVLKESLLTDCKSEIKWLEAAMLGVPSIVSATATMAEVIEEGETGFLARTQDEWRDAIFRLVDDRDLRSTVGENARRKALRDYSLEKQSISLRSQLEDIIDYHQRMQAN